jgi:hypothetical protein
VPDQFEEPQHPVHERRFEAQEVGQPVRGVDPAVGDRLLDEPVHEVVGLSLLRLGPDFHLPQREQRREQTDRPHTPRRHAAFGRT